MIQKMASEGIVNGLVLNNRNKSFYLGCAYDKHSRTPFPTNDQRERSRTLGDLIHFDLCGPMTTPLVGGALYFALFKDDCSGFYVIECLKTKPKTLGAFQRFVAQLKRETGCIVKVVRSDRGIECTNRLFIQYLAEQHIRQKLTTPYTPEQNGAAERDNRTIMEAVHSMLHSSNVHIRFWAEVVHTAVYTLNRTTTRTIAGSTPFEL